MVAYYPLNGNADYVSDNNFNGNVQGNPELFENAINGSGNSYYFDSNNHVITTSNQIDNDLGKSATFSAWIYVDENAAPFTGRILSNFNGNDSSEANCNRRVGFVFGVTDLGAINIFYATSSPLYYGRITAEESIERGKWHHVLTTWDGTRKSSGFKIYIDGKRRDNENFQAGQETSFCDKYIQSEQSFQIGLGTCVTGPCSPFKGAIDEVRIYKRVLNSSEIDVLFSQRKDDNNI
ncbi:LamG domain-containing protein [Ascidiimonas aurantiaca]|uniref:LamG domain-containing protein n=1 Tax=Ascidiimonas aurantiaca TaxID=1685432 RepID=UPI0030EB9D8A